MTKKQLEVKKPYLQHFFSISSPHCTTSALVSLALVLTGQKIVFFYINSYYHVHCKGPKCCRHWLEDLKGWKWIKIQIQKKNFLVLLCKISLQKKLQTKIVSVKKMSWNYKGENLKIDSRLFGEIQVQEIILARTFM